MQIEVFEKSLVIVLWRFAEHYSTDVVLGAEALVIFPFDHYIQQNIFPVPGKCSQLARYAILRYSVKALILR